MGRGLSSHGKKGAGVPEKGQAACKTLKFVINLNHEGKRGKNAPGRIEGSA